MSHRLNGAVCAVIFLFEIREYLEFFVITSP